MKRFCLLTTKTNENNLSEKARQKTISIRNVDGITNEKGMMEILKQDFQNYK